ncbi:hypothetical protein EDB85DRAFT_1895722 [Lactarius pseudohatsudake]|nr:hypothetical protein EDB85DRAFT_1895722 [Lactarius pseudohatsudake]
MECAASAWAPSRDDGSSHGTPTLILPLRGSLGGISMPLATPPTHAASDLNHDDYNATYHSDLDYHPMPPPLGCPATCTDSDDKEDMSEDEETATAQIADYPGETPAIVDRETAAPCGPNHATVPPHPAPNNATASDDDTTMAMATMARRMWRRQSNRNNATTANWHRDTDDDSHGDNGDNDSKMVLRRRCSDSDSNNNADHCAATTTMTVMTVQRQ